MKHLERLARSATPANGVQFRGSAYGSKAIRDFLRDVVALANASVEGARYLIVGVDIDARGRKQLNSIDKADFSGKPAYVGLVNEHIEPPIRLQYRSISVDGKTLGIFEIGDCQDRPYMMRVDYSETLRRGDAYMRINDTAMKMGRRQLQSLFEAKFQDAVSSANIEIGFPGEIIHKDHRVSLCDLNQLPSAIAGAKLKQLLEIKNDLKSRGSTSRMARLTHARLFGSDDPYEDRTSEDLLEDMRQIERDYRDHDEHYRFEQHANEIQLVVYNQGDEAIRDASVTLVMPNHAAFDVAERLPPVSADDRFSPRSSTEQAQYPAVQISDHAVQISARLGNIDAGACVNVFEVPLRACVGSELKGRKFGIQYSMFAQNLRTPARGKLRLLF